jgi:hypothetical protein
MKKLFHVREVILFKSVWLAFAIVLTASIARAERPAENRFLFVVDTASAMRAYSNIVEQAIVELLNSDMKGELRVGDTIGLWTYSDKLRPDFPMQVWSKADKNTIVGNVADFLRELRYEKRAHLDKVMPALQQVIKSSQKVTIIFVFDGSGMITGTPFDKDINELQKQYSHELHSAHVPFITVLAARNGAVFDYTINYPGLVVIPHTAAPEPPPPDTNAPVAVEQAPTPPPKPQRKIEIIMSGPSHVAQAAPKPAPVPPPVLVETPQPLPASAAPITPVTNILAASPATNGATNIATAPLPPAITNAATNIAATPVPHVPVALPAPTLPPPASVGMSSGTQIALFIMAFSLLTIAVVLVVFLIRRSRAGPQSSLISQSIDRTR